MMFTSINDVTQWHRALSQLIDSGKCSSPTFLRPFHFVLLALALKRHGRGITVPESLRAYAARMHLWEAIGLPAPVQVNERDATGRFQPLVALKEQGDVWPISEQISEIFRPSCRDAGTVSSLSSLSAELLGNCYAHSESANGLYGLVCAQVWVNGNKAQIAIGDCGIGIRTSLAASGLYDDPLGDGNACEIATRYQVTSKPGKGHAGYGLTLALGLIEQNNGVLHILSGDEYFYSYRGVKHAGQLPHKLDGTLIVIEWDIANGLDAQAVYNSWPLPEGFDNDDFDF